MQSFSSKFFPLVFFAFLQLETSLAVSTVWSEKPDRKASHGPAGGWTYVGCYTDSASSRTLLGNSSVSNQMTPYLCTTFCQGNNSAPTGMNFAGVEYTKECFCDYNIQGTAVKVNNTDCNAPCGGDGSYFCGGSGFINVYQDMGHKGVLPTSPRRVGNWTYEGCYKDNLNVTEGIQRTLPQRMDISTGVTVEKCTSKCASMGYNITGLEYGQECWCGFKLLNANSTASVTDCSQACNGNHTELCGAANRLSVYVLQ